MPKSFNMFPPVVVELLRRVVVPIVADLLVGVLVNLGDVVDVNVVAPVV